MVPIFICDELAGDYPKDFKFTGWHPQCRCHVEPILKTEAEMEADRKRVEAGGEPSAPEESENYVGALPQGFLKWAEKNAGRIAEARECGTLPYFLRDNEGMIKRALKGFSGEKVDDEDKITLRKRPEEEVRKELHALLKDEASTANPKLIRMMLGKEFTEKGYSLADLNGEYATVEIPSGLIRVHLRHGTNELYENLEFAEDRKHRHGYEIDLCEKFEDGKGADSFNRTLNRYEEYKRNKKGTANSIDMNLKDAAKQADVIVLEVNQMVPLSVINAAMRSRVKRTENIKEIILLRGDKEMILLREDIIEKK